MLSIYPLFLFFLFLIFCPVFGRMGLIRFRFVIGGGGGIRSEVRIGGDRNAVFGVGMCE